jgi:hypothetical protein
LLQLSQLLAQCDESNVQLATKVVSKATVVVVDTKECRTDLADTQLLLLIV